MLKTLFTLIFALLLALPSQGESHWIAPADSHADSLNAWSAFRRDFSLKRKPREMKLKIGVDSKYWLWINGRLVVFEGGLKRGPRPGAGYYDVVDIAPYLSKGTNRVAVLLVHFGRSGFSHEDSGKAGLIIDAPLPELCTDSRWLARLHPSYATMDGPKTNFRLSEQNICYDARQEINAWQTRPDVADYGFAAARERGRWGDAPWGSLEERPIPQWKDFGEKPLQHQLRRGQQEDTLVARLPYNMQFTPILYLDGGTGGQRIGIFTDHRWVSKQKCVEAQYITRPHLQYHESLGWMSGEELWITVPHGAAVERLAYRETGYATEFTGHFECSDDYWQRFWQKTLRTLYVNMRDTYYDCPDRERAQWFGDACILMTQAFYACDERANQLSRKAFRELFAWQDPTTGVLHSPIPGNYMEELPAQMLTSIGTYGLWNYFMHTGDSLLLRESYSSVKRYLDVWQLDSTGLTAERHGGWDWADWGQHNDLRLSYAAWHYMALDGASRMAQQLGYEADAQAYQYLMKQVKAGFDRCWNGEAYRHPGHKGRTDDRVQALAVVSGIAEQNKYEQIARFLGANELASPYMERYVMEALFMMGRGAQAMERAKRRFATMNNDPDRTTLYELFYIGGSSTNHAWSGGPMLAIAERVVGITPLYPGYSRWQLCPDLLLLDSVRMTVPTVAGEIAVAYHQTADNTLQMTLTVPQGTTCYLPYQADWKATVTPQGKNSRRRKAAVSLGSMGYDLSEGLYAISWQRRR